MRPYARAHKHARTRAHTHTHTHTHKHTCTHARTHTGENSSPDEPHLAGLQEFQFSQQYVCSQTFDAQHQSNARHEQTGERQKELCMLTRRNRKFKKKRTKCRVALHHIPAIRTRGHANKESRKVRKYEKEICCYTTVNGHQMVPYL